MSDKKKRIYNESLLNIGIIVHILFIVFNVLFYLDEYVEESLITFNSDIIYFWTCSYFSAFNILSSLILIKFLRQKFLSFISLTLLLSISIDLLLVIAVLPGFLYLEQSRIVFTNLMIFSNALFILLGGLLVFIYNFKEIPKIKLYGLSLIVAGTTTCFYLFNPENLILNSFGYLFSSLSHLTIAFVFYLTLKNQKRDSNTIDKLDDTQG